ncbi:MAG: hypothetical protein ER33_10290 [Cyanobium sp. CACIAM 14]|nr:MAG: hypothetical protein ER33_10290 [Cyanobium sp. CACIAM 14]
MPDRLLSTLLLALCLGVTGPGRAAPAFRATVISVGDGDSLRVRRGDQRITIRLACIDAPERSQSPWGEWAWQALRRRLPIGLPLTVAPRSRDRYGRTVAEVISGSSIGLAQVEAGLAFVDHRHLGACDVRSYLDAEARARRRRLGVWTLPQGVTRPWDYRREQRLGRSHGRQFRSD